jgi:carboxymethylenebutenolidase
VCHEHWAASSKGGGPSPTTVEFTVADGVVPGHLYEPPSGTTVGGPLVVLSDIYGMVPFYHEVSRQLAVAGHPSLLIDLFSREGPLPEVTREAAFARRGSMDEVRGIADASAAVDDMQRHFDVDGAGVIGFCIGGLFALDLAAERDDLTTISYYGFPEGIPAPVRVPAPRPVDVADRMSGPILAFWGENDHNIPTSVVQNFGRVMADTDCDYEAHIYPGAGHGFLQGIMEDNDDTEVARDSWTRTLDLLSNELGGGPR